MNRSTEPSLPPKAIASRVRRSGAYRTCLHASASKATCGKVISAHTLQRSRVLEEIASTDKHVLSFYPFEPEANGRLRVHRRGWHEASTFETFCAKHDSITFAPLEKVPFAGTKEQIFLIAYRAICWELYQKTRAIRSGPTLRDLIDRGAPEQMQHTVQEMIAIQDAGFRKGLADLNAVKHQMDQALLSEDYSPFRAHEFILEGPVAIAATGAITPNRTLGGLPLQTLHDVNAHTQWLSFGVDVRGGGASIVFLWLDQHLAPLSYLEELITLGPVKLSEFLAQFFFAHCENTYFAEDWWYGISEADRLFMMDLMANTNPYYFPPQFDLGRSTAPWRLVSEKRS